MGIISRKVFPACESMCVCCPALRSTSRQPVKRYKKLLAEIFPKSPLADATPNERKIIKLCEYAAKNPFRIPKIAKFLEERCYKEIRSDQIKFICIIAEAYNKLLCHCKEQMAYFATSVLSVVTELLDNSKHDSTKILGFQTLTRFIYSQVDGTYTHTIEKFAHKACSLACEDDDELQNPCLRASSLQCISAMVWFMGEFSYIFAAFDDIVHTILDNYEPEMINQNNEDGDQNCNWVNEVIRYEGRGTPVSGCNSPSCMILRPRTARKDPSLLTKDEIEIPKVWAQICLQNMVDLAKERTTLRLVLDPMFGYLDSLHQWTPPNGLALIVLSDMAYLMESSENKELVLSTVVRHLDHKHVANDPELKAFIVQVAGSLARQIRISLVLRDISFVTDLCRHLRKSFQVTAESVGEQELNSNMTLQNSIEDCLFEITRGIGDTQPLFDMMAIAVEKIPSSGIISRATIGSLLILSHAVSSALSSALRSQQMFPDALLDALLKAMLHPNVETRVGAHGIFSVLIIPSCSQSRTGLASVRSSGYLSESKKLRTNTTSSFASISVLLDKLRREKDGIKIEKNRYNNTHEDLKSCKSSPNFHKLNIIIDKTSGFTNLIDTVPTIMKFSEDQIGQLLSAFWIQSILLDNLPSNIEAISHSLSLMLLSLRVKNFNDGFVVRAFQLLFSLRNLSLDLNNGTLPAASKRLILVLSTSTLMFAAKIYQIPHICDLLKSQLPADVDPYLYIGDDLQARVRLQANMKDFGSMSDNQMAASTLFELRSKLEESNVIITEIVAKNLYKITKLNEADVISQFSESFTPDDAFLFGPRLAIESDPHQSISKESLSFDEDIPVVSSMVDDDVTSELSVADISRFLQKASSPSPQPQIISIGQLMESALEVAGEVVGSSVSISPLPYDKMTSRCETFGAGTRQKLSKWLASENRHCRDSVEQLSDDDIKVGENMDLSRIEVGQPQNLWSTMGLPPSSPFDNFLKAAGAGC